MKRNIVLHRVMTGGVPSEPAEGTQYGELPEYEGDTEFDVSRPQSCKLNILFLTRMQTCYVVGSKNLYICTRICICFDFFPTWMSLVIFFQKIYAVVQFLCIS